MPEDLRIELLGELELLRAGRPVALPASKKTRALLGYLVLARASEHSRRRLCDLLWDGPADPRAALRWSLSKLRPLVDGPTPRILADREHVRFEPAGARVDLFELRTALQGELEAQDIDALERAAARFHGELLEGLELEDCFAFAHWLAGERERARNLRVRLLAHLVGRLAAEPARALEHARAWVALEPLDEGAHAALASSLARLGRPADARRAQRACREHFERELGRAPTLLVGDSAQSPNGAREEHVPAPAPGQRVARQAVTEHEDAGLFGRAEECAHMERFLDGALQAGPRRVLCLQGEPGIGKTRLLHELLERARGRGCATRYGKAFEAETSRPLGVFEEALGAARDEAALDGRTQLFGALRAEVQAADEGHGVLVALDDVQWIDELSAALVSWLAREAPDVTLALAVRPGEVADNPAAARLVRALSRDGRLEPLELAPLGPAETLALARSVAPENASERVHELSGGNPLFALEVARGGPTASDGRVSTCIAERLARLDSTDREVLRVGAAVGRRFSLELVGAVAGLRAGELLASVERLRARGFLRASGEDEVDFAHDLVRGAAYAALSDPARRLLHRRIARSLADDPRGDAELAPDLARHAALAGEQALAATACVAAGERCLRLFAFGEASAFARRGRQHAAALCGGEERRLRVELLALEVHAGLGRHEPAELVRELEALAERARTAGEAATARNALYLLSVLDEEAGDFRGAAARTLAAVAEGRHADAATQARALANTGRCLAQLERELPEAERVLSEAESRAAGEAASLDLAWGRGLLALHQGELDEASRWLERALELARETDNHWAGFECLARLSLVDLARRGPERVLARRERLAEAARRLGEGSERALVQALLSLARHALDEPGAGEELAESLRELRRHDNKAALSMLLNEAAALDARAGRAELARARAAEALAAAEHVGREVQVARARRLLESEDLGEDNPEEPDACRP